MKYFNYCNTPLEFQRVKRSLFNDDIVEVFIDNLATDGSYTFDADVIRESWINFKANAEKDLALLYGYRSGDELVLPYAYKIGFVCAMDLENGSIIEIPFTRNNTIAAINNLTTTNFGVNELAYENFYTDTVGYVFDRPTRIGLITPFGNVSVISPNKYNLSEFYTVREKPPTFNNYHGFIIDYYTVIPSNSFYLKLRGFVKFINTTEISLGPASYFGVGAVLKSDGTSILQAGSSLIYYYVSSIDAFYFELISSNTWGVDSISGICFLKRNAVFGLSDGVSEHSVSMVDLRFSNDFRKSFSFTNSNSQIMTNPNLLNTTLYDKITTYSEVNNTKVGRNTDAQTLVENDKVYAIILKR